MPSDEENVPWVSPKELWLRAWHDGFSALLKWDEPKIREWAAQWERDLNSRDAWIWHDDPAEYVVATVMREVFGEPFRRLGGERALRLRRELATALSHGSNVRQAVETRNWQEKRAIVADILATYGGRLP